MPPSATYFVAGEAWTLSPQAALLPEEDDTDRSLAAAVRLRVLLALAEEYERIMQKVVEHASFRYGRRSDESVGVVAGRLDVSTYVRSRSQIKAPRRYPIRVVERQVATPENLLAAAALHSLLDALDRVPVDVLPRTRGPERRAIDERRAALTRISQLPLLGAIAPAARELARKGRLERQREIVLRRLNRRDIAHPEAYATLTGWVSRYLTGASPISGDVAWAFYDYRFDTKLFEIWSLSALATALTTRFGPPLGGELRPLWIRDDKPRGSWQTSYGRIELHFQRDAAALGLSRRWGITARNHHLGAFPDITFRMEAGGERLWCLLDCKLRRRRPLPLQPEETLDLPVEEIYKMLGYFEHLAPGTIPTGALVYYTPSSARSALMERARDSVRRADGFLLLAGVDPVMKDESDQVFAEVVDLLGRQIGEPSEAVRQQAELLAEQVRAAGGDGLEAEATKKARLFQEVVAAWAQQHPAQRETVESATRASFRAEDWLALDYQTQRMLISAEAYAIHQSERIDYSGPLLVLCAACERELNLRFFAPLTSEPPLSAPDETPSLSARPTLGQGLFFLRNGLAVALAREKGQTAKIDKLLASAKNPHEASAFDAIADRLSGDSYDLSAVTKLIERLSALNKRYRRVAAHDAAVERETWVLGRGLVLGPDQVIHDIVHGLPSPSTTVENGGGA